MLWMDFVFVWGTGHAFKSEVRATKTGYGADKKSQDVPLGLENRKEDLPFRMSFVKNSK